MNYPIRILYLITELDTGGAQTALFRLLGRLDRRKFLPVVACFYNGDCTVGRQIKSLGIPVVDLSTHEQKWRLDSFWRLYRLLKRERPSILHTWLYHANVAGRIVGRLAGVPAIISAERNIHLSSTLRNKFNRLTAAYADRITCVSQSVADYAIHEIKLPAEKTLVIPNGIDLEDFPGLANSQAVRCEYGLPLDAFLIGSVGRLHPVKNHDLLVRAFAMLEPSLPGTHLVLIGDGPQRAALTALCAELGLISKQRVTFLGNQTEIPALLSALDLFVLPSLYEGMPNAVLEAMAAGLPVLATASGGTAEIIQDGVNGMLVPPGDLKALLRGMQTLVSDRPLRRSLGDAARLHVQESFSLDQTVRRTINLYEEILTESGE